MQEGKTGADLFRWAADAGLVLESLVPERFSLEDIFTSLTVADEEGHE